MFNPSSLFLVSGNEHDKQSMAARTVFVPIEMLKDFKLDPKSGARLIEKNAKGGKLLLKETEAAKKTVHDGFNSIKQVTAACHAIIAAEFNEPTKHYSWYKDLVANLNNVKHFANDWVHNLSVDITSNIPSSIINYNTQYQAHMGTVASVLDKYDITQMLSSADLAAVRDIFGRLKDKVSDINKDYIHCGQRMKNWQGEADPKNKIFTGMMGAAHSLSEGTGSIQNAEKDLQKDITKFNSEITGLEAEIRQYSRLIGTSAIMVGGGAFAAIAGGIIAIAFPPIGGIIAFFGIGSLVTGSVLWGVYQAKINAANSKIVDLKSNIKESQHTLLALDTLSVSADSVVSSANDSVKAISDVQVLWQTNEMTLKTLVEALTLGNDDVVRYLIENKKNLADKSWDELSAFAKDLLKSGDKVELMTMASLLAA